MSEFQGGKHVQITEIVDITLIQFTMLGPFYHLLLYGSVSMLLEDTSARTLLLLDLYVVAHDAKHMPIKHVNIRLD